MNAISNVVELLQNLIQIGSVSPDSETTGTTTDNVGEANLAHQLKAFIEGYGAEVELDEVLPNRFNLIARCAPLDGRPRILLGPHLDTVDVGQMTIPPFDATIEDEKIWGRGASDTKGPMAAMLWSWIEQLECLKTSPTAIDFVAFCGEESYQQGSKHFAAKHAQDYQFALVGEPTDLQLVHVSKGALWVKLTAKGKSVHSSQPHLGENALHKLIDGVQRLEGTFKSLTENDQTKHPILGNPTINLGVIHGGTRPNIVPSEATALVDFRTTPALVGKDGFFKTLCEISEKENWPVTLSEANEERFPMDIPHDHAVIQAIQSIAPDSHCVGAPWFSDAALLSYAGLPAICVGPGSIDQAHTKDEFINISDLKAGRGFFKDTISKLKTLTPEDFKQK